MTVLVYLTGVTCMGVQGRPAEGWVWTADLPGGGGRSPVLGSMWVEKGKTFQVRAAAQRLGIGSLQVLSWGS